MAAHIFYCHNDAEQTFHLEFVRYEFPKILYEQAPCRFPCLVELSEHIRLFSNAPTTPNNQDPYQSCSKIYRSMVFYNVHHDHANTALVGLLKLRVSPA